MGKIIEQIELIKFFELENKKAEQYSKYTLLDIAQKEKLDLYSKNVVKEIRQWAEIHYPEAETIDQASFAILVVYFATNDYVSYGTRLHKKEREAEIKAYAFYDELLEDMAPKEMSKKIIELCIRNILE